MEIVDLANQGENVREAAARLLLDNFDAPGGWPDLASALQEVTRVNTEGFARAMLDGNITIGWVGGLSQYMGRVWELHPLVVHREYRHHGIGRELMRCFESEASRRGGLTATLGTDDVSGMTSLSDVDLYEDIPRYLKEIHDLGNQHPFLFYQKLGYAVTGVLPDANGAGRPDIFMSKRLAG
jgi:aminoglycoside 6'-N-acetyltransferase I